MIQDFCAYTTIEQPCEILQVIKKSKFYGRLFPAQTPEEAQAVLDACKKRYWDASHNCSAYVIGRMGELSRCSDDGEPQGTAGVPMLEALKKSGLTNVLAVVTRYFGGTLLGAGGLVRAYTSSVSEAVKAAQKICFQPMDRFRIVFPFPLWGRAEAALRSEGCRILSTEYTDRVCVEVHLPPGAQEQLIKRMAEISAGGVRPEFLRTEYARIELGGEVNLL